MKSYLSPSESRYRPLSSPKIDPLLYSDAKLLTLEHESHIKTLENKVQKLESLLTMKEKEKEMIIQNYQTLTDKIRVDLQSIRNAEVTLKTTLLSATNENERLKSEFANEIEELQAQLSIKEGEVNLLKKRREEEERGRKEKEEEIATLKFQMNQNLEENNLFKSRVAELERKNKDLKAKEEELINLRLQMAQILDESNISKTKASELERKNKELSLNNSELERNLSLNKEEFRISLDNYSKDVEMLKRQNNEKIGLLEERSEELESENRELRAKLELLTKEIDGKEIEIMRMGQKINEAASLREMKDLEVLKQKNLMLSQTKEMMIERLREEHHTNSICNPKSLNNNNNYDNHEKVNKNLDFRTENRKITQSVYVVNNESEKNGRKSVKSELDFYDRYLKNEAKQQDTYGKTLTSIKELDKEISSMNEDYQGLLAQSQNAKLSKDKEEIRQKIFYLSDILRQKTNKMHDLKLEEEGIKTGKNTKGNAAAAE